MTVTMSMFKGIIPYSAVDSGVWSNWVTDVVYFAPLRVGFTMSRDHVLFTDVNSYILNYGGIRVEGIPNNKTRTIDKPNKRILYSFTDTLVFGIPTTGQSVGFVVAYSAGKLLGEWPVGFSVTDGTSLRMSPQTAGVRIINC
jgi:hypothetical protein